MAVFGTGAKLLVFNESGDVLVLRRSDTHPRKPHWTDLPGGIVDRGEPEVTAVVRELQEETGITIDPQGCILFYSHTHMLPSGRSFTKLVYLVHLDHTPDVTLSYEHESYEWCSVDTLMAREDLERGEKHAIEYALANNLFDV